VWDKCVYIQSSVDGEKDFISLRESNKSTLATIQLFLIIRPPDLPCAQVVQYGLK